MLWFSLRACLERFAFLVGVEVARCSGRGVDMFDEGASLGLCSGLRFCLVSIGSGFMMGIVEMNTIRYGKPEDSLNAKSVLGESIPRFE